jgi:hypothetical protein
MHRGFQNRGIVAALVADGLELPSFTLCTTSKGQFLAVSVLCFFLVSVRKNLFFFFLWYWGLSRGLCTFKAGTLPLKPFILFIFLVVLKFVLRASCLLSRKELLSSYELLTLNFMEL